MQIKKVSASATHTLFISASGQLFATGKGDLGQLAMTMDNVHKKSISDFSNAAHSNNSLVSQGFNLSNIHQLTRDSREPNLFEPHAITAFDERQI